MALITCPDCQASISDAAPACPRCGRPAMKVGMAPVPPPSPPVPSPFEVWLSSAIAAALVWAQRRLERVSVATWKRMLLTAVGATICIAGWGAWRSFGPPAQRQAEHDFISAHCDDGTPFATCQALVAKRNVEAHETAAAVTAKERADGAVRANWVPASSTGFLVDRVGDVGVLTEQASVFLTRDDFNESITLAVAHDLEGFTALALRRSMVCPTGTGMRILEVSSGSARRVRIQDGPFAGASGWMTTGVLRSH